MRKIVEIKDLSLTYHSTLGETKALSNISFDILPNEFVAIVGPSGCGKTTILSILSGLIKNYEGEVLVDGKKPSTKNNLCGYMFQKDNLLPWRNIRKNLYLGLEIKGKKTKRNIEYAEKLAEKYGISTFLDKTPSELSGGMRQRVSLIRTLVTNPQLLLLDEPFSALDFTTRLKLCDDVREIINKEHKTAILVTHDILEAISMADKIIVLTNRPAKIKAIHYTNLPEELSPFERRNSMEGNILFDKIWREIQDEDS